MGGHNVSARPPSLKFSNNSHFPPQPYQEGNTPPLSSSSDENDYHSLPSNGGRNQAQASPLDAENYFNSLHSLKSSRAGSVYSLSRISLSSQLSQLTALSLPNATSLSTSISSIPTAPAAASTLGSAAEQIRKWLQKATEVLNGLDAEDDVEWAAAGGREGLAEVDGAIGKFEGLIGVYVTAIEDLQEREDLSKVPPEQLKALVDQMENILKEWETVRRSLKSIKSQVELAMEWEELWNVVLGDIGLEMENLSKLVFEMEEARHKAIDTALDGKGELDIQELDTIVEEAPTVEIKSDGHRLSLPSGFQGSSPVSSPGPGIAQDDSRLLALFAKMQPLRASLDFLPMTLSNFQSRAEKSLPSACKELESRRISLEKKWKTLESEAEGLRQELGEDRWVLVFRNAGRQAQKLCKSVERTMSKLQEAIDVGMQHSNPPLLTKKVEAYEAKKSHYGPAITKVLAIIEKGVTDRLTVNGEILRVHLDIKARWQNIETDLKNMDLALDDLTMNKNQQLRDSISSIVSMDRSANGNGTDTPGSSPASSVAMGPTNGTKRDPSPGMNGSSRRNSTVLNSAARPNGSRRYFSLPQNSAASTSLPRKTPTQRSFTSHPSSRDHSPSPYAKSSATPTPGNRPRPNLQADNKPRWNSSSKVDYIEFTQKPKPHPFTPPLGRKSSLFFRPPSSAGSRRPSVDTTTPIPTPPPNRPRLSTGAQSSMGMRRASAKDTTPSLLSPSIKKLNSPNTTPGAVAAAQAAAHHMTEASPSARPRPSRPSTALGNSRRFSMLPVPKNSAGAPLAGRE